MLHLELLALPGASSLPARRLEELPQSEGQQSGCPQLRCVLQPPSQTGTGVPAGFAGQEQLLLCQLNHGAGSVCAAVWGCPV